MFKNKPYINNSHWERGRGSNENCAGNRAGSTIVGVRFPRVVGKVWGRSRRIGGPAVLPVTAAVLTFLLRPVTTHSRGYIRDVKTRTHALTHARIGWLHTSRATTTYIWTRAGRDIGGCFRTRFTIIIRRRCTSTRVSTFARKVVGYVGWKVQVQLGPLHPYISTPPPPSSPSSSGIALFLFPSALLYANPPPRFSLSLAQVCRTALKQTPPLTSRIKPFNCRIVFDGSFSTVKLLFKLRDAGVLSSRLDRIRRWSCRFWFASGD